jgi:hypothetical protein
VAREHDEFAHTREVPQTIGAPFSLGRRAACRERISPCAGQCWRMSS